MRNIRGQDKMIVAAKEAVLAVELNINKCYVLEYMK